MGATSIFYFRSCMNDGISQFIKLQSLQYRQSIAVKGIHAVRIDFFYILKVANIRCFILIAVEIFHNIIRK